MDTQCTPAQELDIIKAAQERVRFLLWIADNLLRTDSIDIRREAAKAIRELVGK